MKCPGPAFCPFASESRFRWVLAVIVILLLMMSAIALAAIIKGKDGVITGAVCSAMTAVVTTILVGGLHKHRNALKSATMPEGGDTDGRSESADRELHP